MAGSVTQDVQGKAWTTADRGSEEFGHRSARVDRGFEAGPTGEAQLTGDDELGGGQADRVRLDGQVLGEPGERAFLAVAGGVA